jgi:WD40 repeat protein
VAGSLPPRPATVTWWDDLDDRISSLAWSPGGDVLAAGSLGGHARVYGTDGALVDAPVDNQVGVLCLAWSCAGTHLAVGGQDGGLTLWEAERRACTRLGHRDWVNAVAWSPGAVAPALAVAAGMDVALYRPGGVLVAEFPFQPGTVNDLAWVGRPARLAAGCRGGVRWLAFSEPPPLDADTPLGAALVLAPDPSGHLLAAGDVTGAAHLWDFERLEHIELRGYPSGVELVAWDGAGAGLIAVADDAITVWAVSATSDGVAVSEGPLLLQGHDGSVSAIAPCPGRTLLASAGSDGLLALWDPASTSEELECLDLGVEISRCSWRPGTATLAVGTTTGAVGVVELRPRA